MKLQRIQPRFVELIPKELDDGVLYISEKYKVAVHKCACGCGQKVVTPLSPADWQIRKQGELVSLHPSIGNWNFECRSHYWIRGNEIVWAAAMSKAEVDRVQARDRRDKARYIADLNKTKQAVDESAPIDESGHPISRTWWQRLLSFLFKI